MSRTLQYGRWTESRISQRSAGLHSSPVDVDPGYGLGVDRPDPGRLGQVGLPRNQDFLKSQEFGTELL